VADAAAVRAGGGEQPRALADDDGIGEQDHLVDQAVLVWSERLAEIVENARVRGRPSAESRTGTQGASQFLEQRAREVRCTAGSVVCCR
jgi:hypothetical protein